MPLQRLRRVLGGRYRVTVESSPELVRKVNRKKARRRSDLLAKQATVPASKTAAVVAALAGRQNWTIRAIDLLRKIGYLTTPSWVNMAQLSASWAIRRYIWAVADPGRGAPAVSDLRLSSDARAMDFHQKTLLSDEFGIGMGGLLVESFFQTDSFSDVSVALGDPVAFQDIVQQGEAQPDYLLWAEAGNTPYYLVASYDQLRRGLEQVRTIQLGPGPRQLLTLVIATCLLDEGTEVFVLDPPPEDDSKSKRKKSKAKSREREFRVEDRKISNISGAIHYLQPGGSSLLSRGVYNMQQVEAEELRRTNPQVYRARRDEGYLRGVEEDRPAVINVNMFFASLAVHEFLGRLHPFRNLSNSSYAVVRGNLMEPFLVLETDGAPCHAHFQCSSGGSPAQEASTSFLEESATAMTGAGP